MKKRFRTNVQKEWDMHFIQKHPGKTGYLGKADLKKYGWEPQGKP